MYTTVSRDNKTASRRATTGKNSKLRLASYGAWFWPDIHTPSPWLLSFKKVRSPIISNTFRFTLLNNLKRPDEWSPAVLIEKKQTKKKPKRNTLASGTTRYHMQHEKTENAPRRAIRMTRTRGKK